MGIQIAPSILTADFTRLADEVESIAEEAFVYGFPMVMNYAVFFEYFVDRNSPAYLPQSRAAVVAAVRLLEAFRAAGRPVFFVRHAHRDPARDGGLMAGWWAKVCRDGRPESRVAAALAPRPGETVVRKTRYSAFTNPRLARALRAAGVEDLVLCGLATNLCVESSARAAFDLGLRTFVPADATVAHDEELHLGALRNLAQGFSRVMLADDIVAAVSA